MDLGKMSEAEKQIMQIVWSANKPLSSKEILDLLPDEREVKITTVLTFLTRLTKKNILCSKKEGKKNIYSPLISETEYKKYESKEFLDTIHGGSIKSFVATLCDSKEISEEEIQELKDWLLKR